MAAGLAAVPDVVGLGAGGRRWREREADFKRPCIVAGQAAAGWCVCPSSPERALQITRRHMMMERPRRAEETQASGTWNTDDAAEDLSFVQLMRWPRAVGSVFTRPCIFRS